MNPPPVSILNNLKTPRWPSSLKSNYAFTLVCFRLPTCLERKQKKTTPPELCCLTKCYVKMSCSTTVISMLSYLLFTQSELLSPKAHKLLLVAIAFSSTILLNPNPHIDLLCTLVINYPQVKRLKWAGPKLDRAHFTESHLINIFIFLYDLTPKAFIQSMRCVWVFQRSSSKPCQLYGPTVIAALICLLMTDVMQSHFATDKICRRLDASHAEPPSLSYSLKCKHMRLGKRQRRGALICSLIKTCSPPQKKCPLKAHVHKAVPPSLEANKWKFESALFILWAPSLPNWIADWK